MNQVIEQLSTRKSIRQFTGESVKTEDLELIIKTAQRCPNLYKWNDPYKLDTFYFNKILIF